MVPDVHWHVLISPEGVSVVSTYLIWFTVGDSTEVYSYSKCVGALDTTIIRPLPLFLANQNSSLLILMKGFKYPHVSLEH